MVKISWLLMKRNVLHEQQMFGSLPDALFEWPGLGLLRHDRLSLRDHA